MKYNKVILEIALPHPTSADILIAFNTTGRSLTPEDAALISQEIAAYGGLTVALAALLNDGGHVLHSRLLAYQSALAEIADPERRIARLRLEAHDLDARAEPLWAEGAEFAGRAAWRQMQGELELAQSFQNKAQVAENLAADLETQAFAKRLQSASLQADLACRQALSDTLKEIAA